MNSKQVKPDFFIAVVKTSGTNFAIIGSFLLIAKKTPIEYCCQTIPPQYQNMHEEGLLKNNNLTLGAINAKLIKQCFDIEGELSDNNIQLVFFVCNYIQLS